MPNGDVPSDFRMPFQGYLGGAKAPRVSARPAGRDASLKRVCGAGRPSPFDITAPFAIIVIKVCSDSFYANIYHFCLGLPGAEKRSPFSLDPAIKAG